LKYIKLLKKHFPFKILHIKYCEGDDIIGSIVSNKKNKEYIIISSDEDYLQLCKNGVKLFSINKQCEVSHPKPEMFLKEKCLIGQSKDNIFNILTPLDYPNELRKPPFGKKKAEKFLVEGLEKSLNENKKYKRKYVNELGETIIYNAEINLKERYEFNRNLIDFSRIPKIIIKEILNQYDSYKYPKPEMIYKFFELKNWPYFLDNIVNVENRLFELYGSQK